MGVLDCPVSLELSMGLEAYSLLENVHRMDLLTEFFSALQLDE